MKRILLNSGRNAYKLVDNSKLFKDVPNVTIVKPKKVKK